MRSAALTHDQIRGIDWQHLRSGRGDSSSVARDLEALLLGDSAQASAAYAQLENAIESQGRIFECAPAAVAVIIAAIADDVIPAGNVASSLDLLGRVLAGRPDRSELDTGRDDLREAVYSEAIRGYWLLVRIARRRDVFNAWDVAADVVYLLDDQYPRPF